jgi:adenosylcobinamide kinase / adenosylcobinamide-phosphate guanylyltransferase
MAEDMVHLNGSELILGGQRSGKSRRAETLARAWLDASPEHRSVFIATGQAWDNEMQTRIERHQRDRAASLPQMTTVETPLAVAEAVRQHGAPDTLVVIDCLTLWLTNLLMPLAPAQALSEAEVLAAGEALCVAIADAAGPVVLVSNEVGLGVVPMGREVRAYVDALGRLNQQVAGVCARVTLMAAGLPLALKGNA